MNKKFLPDYGFVKFACYLVTMVYLFVRLGCKGNRVYPFFPLVVSSRMTLLTQWGASVECSPGSFLLLGFGGGGFGSFSYTGINLELLKKSKLKLSGRSMIGYGSSISLSEDAQLEIGRNTYIGGRAMIKCSNLISIGNECAISWNVTLLDSDLHSLTTDELSLNSPGPIIIKDHVWIGCNVTILKNVTIGRGSVIGAGSVVTRSVPDRCLAVGNPARVIKENISWA
jgi:acetyltransferase-like isoleucine patch superfamily enzyme